MLASMGASLRSALDLYAGSGALGIEALSRGAEVADFIERDPAACAVIHGNLERTGYMDRSRVFCISVERGLARLDRCYDVVFLDPPYVDPAVPRAWSRIASSPIVGEGTIVVYEHGRRTSPPDTLGPLARLQTRTHGSSSVSFYHSVHVGALPEEGDE